MAAGVVGRRGRVPHPSLAERAARGKAARASVSRSSHADWEAPAGRRAPEDVLLEQAADRVPELVPIRRARMLASPFAFFRGAAALMTGDLAGTPHSGLPVQLCGDAHLSNFGGFAAPDRELVFDINDFDETARGPWEWDVKRLAASIAIAGRELGLASALRRDTVEAAVGSYRTAMRRFAAMRNLELWYVRLDVPRVLSHAGDQVSRQERRAFKRRVASAQAKDHLRAVTKLTERVDGAPRIVSRPPLIVPVEDLIPGASGEAVEEQVRSLLRTYRRSLPVERRHLLEGYRYRHMARRVGGVGSVGTRTWIVLLTGRDDDDPLFLQVKQAGPSVIERYAGREPSRHHGQRVVQGQRLMQVDGDIFLGWLRADWAACQCLRIKAREGTRRVAVSTVVVDEGDRPLFVHVMVPHRETPSPGGVPAVLTPRQQQGLRLLAEGVPAKVIATRLGLAEATVRNHIRAILAALETHSQLEAIAKARRLQLIT